MINLKKIYFCIVYFLAADNSIINYISTACGRRALSRTIKTIKENIINDHPPKGDFELCFEFVNKTLFYRFIEM